MINRFQIENYKSIAKANLGLGRLNVFFGLNASGKSNLFEGLTLYKHLVDGRSINEALNGISENASYSWQGVRGGSQHVLSKSAKKRGEATITFKVKINEFEHVISFDPTQNLIIRESPQYPDTVAHYLPRDRSFLSRSPEIFEASQMFSYNFHLEKLRSYSRVLNSNIPISENGEGFASAVYSIIDKFHDDPESNQQEFRAWLNETISEEIQEILTDFGANGDVLFGLVENDEKTMAPSLSDGTLRFSAMLASLLQKNPPKIMLFEEPETGLHPSRIRTLVHLFEQSLDWHNSQIFVSTHSPIFLAWLQQRFYINTFVCYRNSSGDTQIKSVQDFENFNDIIQKNSLSISELMLENWFEFNS